VTAEAEQIRNAEFYNSAMDLLDERGHKFSGWRYVWKTFKPGGNFRQTEIDTTVTQNDHPLRVVIGRYDTDRSRGHSDTVIITIPSEGRSLALRGDGLTSRHPVELPRYRRLFDQVKSKFDPQSPIQPGQ